MTLLVSPSSPIIIPFGHSSSSVSGGHGSFCSEDMAANTCNDELQSQTKCDPRMHSFARELFPGTPCPLSQSAPNQANSASILPRAQNEEAARYRRSNSDNDLSFMHRLSLRRMQEYQIWSPTLDDVDSCIVWHDVDSCIEYTLSDLGFSNSSAASGSSFAFTEPFQMLSPEACYLLRNEILSTHTQEQLDENMDKAAYFTHESSFIRDLETSQKFEDLMNRLVDVPVVACGTAHVLIRGPGASAALDWHRDESTLCCVIMLSKVPAGAKGGETYVKKGDAKEFCLKFPEAEGGIGCAYLMQGSHFEHRFGRALNFECMTLTVWLRPADGWNEDDRNLSRANQCAPELLGISPIVFGNASSSRARSL